MGFKVKLHMYKEKDGWWNYRRAWKFDIFFCFCLTYSWLVMVIYPNWNFFSMFGLNFLQFWWLCVAVLVDQDNIVSIKCMSWFWALVLLYLLMNFFLMIWDKLLWWLMALVNMLSYMHYMYVWIVILFLHYKKVCIYIYIFAS